jgi:hypothetical protein
MKPIMPPRKISTTTPILKEVTELSGESPKIANRAQTRRASAKDVLATNADETFAKLFEVLGNTNINEPKADISPFEIDVLALELITVRDAKDILEGRESALKAYATEVINQRIQYKGKDYSETSGYLVSPENGVKLSKEVTGGKLNIDVQLLEKVLDEDQFRSVVNHVVVMKTTNYPGGKTVEETEAYFELNEEALEKELKLGNIGMEQIVKATTPGKIRTSFYVRSL